MSRISIASSIRNRGMSLIELMIALALMLLVMYAVTNLYLSTKLTINTQNGVNRVAENAQTSVDLLSRSMRQAAYVGCPSVGETSAGKQRIDRSSLNLDPSAPSDLKIEEEYMAQIIKSSDSGIDGVLANSPVVEIFHAASGGAHLRQAMSDRDSSVVPLRLTTNPGFQTTAGRTFGIISKCGLAGGEIFEVLSVSEVPGAGWDVLTKKPLRTNYDPDTRVHPLQRMQYFVKSKSVETTPPSTTNVLYKRTLGSNGLPLGDAVPIIQDIDRLDISAELDTDVARDYASDETKSYKSLTKDDYQRIVGIQIQMRLATPDSVRGTDGKSIKRDFNPWITIRARAT